MGIAKAMEGLDDLAPSPGPMFRLGVVASAAGATAFLMWLARVMTERGIGDGLLVLFAAPFVAHLRNGVADGVKIVGTGLAPAWAPPALAALVVAAVALLVGSTMRARGSSGLDIWPPLLGTIVFQALALVIYLSAGPLVDDLPATARVLVLLAAQGGLIWLFAAWRGRGREADPGPLGAEIVVCAGALLLPLVFGVGGPMTGSWIILCVAAGLSVASGKAQADGGLSGPTPTA
jgi:hypothetical protein